MKTLVDLTKTYIPHFNELPCDEVDFTFVTDLKDFHVCEMALKKRGYHAWDEEEKIDFIFIKKTLKGLKWLETAFHELFHAIFGVPMKELHDKHQKEVVALSLIAVIPQPMLNDYTFLEENPTPYARKLYKERQKIYFLYGV